jgi:Arc/MetJ-type ribon-helix-helix transcriptional regulator
MVEARLTIRLPMQDLNIIDMFLKSGECSTRSEFIRHAVREYSQNHVEEIIKKAEAMKKIQEIVSLYEASEEYLKK